MSPIIIVIIAMVLLGIAIAISMMIKYATNKDLRCPHCQIEFVTELFMIQDNTFLACPFCRRWILVTKSNDQYIAKKLFA